MHKCTDREDDTENCMITAQYQMLKFISYWNIRKKYLPIYEKEKLKRNPEMFSRTFE